MKDTLDAIGAPQRITDAKEARARLLVDAASGKPVTAQALRDADEALRRAEIDAELAAEVSKHQTTQACKEAVGRLEDQAAKWGAEMKARAADHIHAAAELDKAMEDARKAADRFSETRQALEAADHAGHALNGQVEAEARVNHVLEDQHRSTWPKARTMGSLPCNIGADLRAELVVTVTRPRLQENGAHDEVLLKSAEQAATQNAQAAVSRLSAG